MKKYVKDIGMFGLGSVALGGVSSAVGRAYGSPYTGGLSTMATGLPTIGSLVIMKHGVRLLKPKKLRLRW